MVVGAYEAKDWAPWSCISNIETQSIFHNNVIAEQGVGIHFIQEPEIGFGSVTRILFRLQW